MTRGTLFGLGLLVLSCSASRTADSRTAGPGGGPTEEARFASAPHSGAAPAWTPQPVPHYPGSPHPEREAGGSPDRSGPAVSGPTRPEGSKKDGSGALAERYASRPALETYSGKASYYADSLSGRRTASGERYDPKRHSAAHPKLPFGTVIRVVRRDTGATTYARINDRGPFGRGGRIVDLSRAAAEELEMLRAGVVSVRVEVVERPNPP